MKRIAPLVLPLWFLLACGPSTREPSPPTRATVTPSLRGPRPVKLVLFPYIPDAAGDKFQALIHVLKSGFEQVHPQISLQIVIDPAMDLYDLTPGKTLAGLLGSGAEAAAVVEIDTILLGDLVAN